MGTSINPSPAFASAQVRSAAVTLSLTADTLGSTPTHGQVLLAAGNSGTKIRQLVFMATGETVAGLVGVYLDRGGIFTLEDTVLVPGGITPSTTVAPWRLARPYPALLMPPYALITSSLIVTSFVANQPMQVHAFGGDF